MGENMFFFSVLVKNAQYFGLCEVSLYITENKTELLISQF